jgi:hypothetical protein
LWTKISAKRKEFPNLSVRSKTRIISNTEKDSTGNNLTVSIKTIMNDAYSRNISIKTRSAYPQLGFTGNIDG